MHAHFSFPTTPHIFILSVDSSQSKEGNISNFSWTASFYTHSFFLIHPHSEYLQSNSKCFTMLLTLYIILILLFYTSYGSTKSSPIGIYFSNSWHTILFYILTQCHWDALQKYTAQLITSVCKFTGSIWTGFPCTMNWQRLLGNKL